VNHRKKMKADPNRLIPLKPIRNLLELSIVVGLFVYHLEGLRVPLLVRVPQFGNHCPKGYSRKVRSTLDQHLYNTLQNLFPKPKRSR